MLVLTEAQVSALLDWEEIVPAIEAALLEISAGNQYVMPPRSILAINKGFFLTMPSYSQYQNLIACKLLSAFPVDGNTSTARPSTATVVAFDGETGYLKATLEAEALTAWRTAAGSIVATKHLHCSDREKYRNMTLAVLGAGLQGHIHLIGFQKYFRFGHLRLWNRTVQRAKSLAEKLRNEENMSVSVYDDVDDCVRDADVIVLTFSATQERYLTTSNVKPGAFICTVSTSFSAYPSGIDEEIYHSSRLFTESIPSALSEMSQFLKKEDLSFQEVGRVIKDVNAFSSSTDSKRTTIYQSLGVSLMDNAAANYLIKKHESLAR